MSPMERKTPRETISYGIICCLQTEPTLFFVVRKRHSYALITFICNFMRKHISLLPENYSLVYKYFTEMLFEEKMILLKLATTLFNEKNEENRKSMYMNFFKDNGPKPKPTTVENGVRVLLSIFTNGIKLGDENLTMEAICTDRASSSKPVWEFPKGHRHKNNETPFQCAKREFYEETKINPERHKIVFNTPRSTKATRKCKCGNENCFESTYIEKIVGTDENNYTYEYFTANYSSQFHRELNRHYSISNTEVSESSWKSFEELQTLWKNRYPDRIHILEKISNKLKR